MEFGKHGSSDSSSDEYDPKDDSDDPTKRPYECTFCKRGFTNAQALGGHMNIHRKDRAKAKSKQRNFNSASSQYDSNAHYNQQFESSSKYFAPFSTQPSAAYYPTASDYEAPRRSNYRMYFEPSTTAAAADYPIIHQPRSQTSLSLNEELLGANLSLQIDQTRSVWKNDEVDLELRLGHEYR